MGTGPDYTNNNTNNNSGSKTNNTTNNNNNGSNNPNNKGGGPNFNGIKGRASNFAIGVNEVGGQIQYDSAVRDRVPQQQQQKAHKDHETCGHGHGTCQWCKGGHTTLQCPSFWNDLNPIERLEQFNRGFWCYNCTSTEHTTRDCPHPRAKCDLCSKPHLTILHRDRDTRAKGKFNPGNFIPIGQKPLEPTNGNQTGNNNGTNNNNRGDGNGINNENGENNATGTNSNNNGIAASLTNLEATVQNDRPIGNLGS